MDKIRKIVPALDLIDLDMISRLIEKIDSHDLIYGYKAGFSLGLTHGLPKVAERIRAISKKPLIYDHQKAATDIPDTGKLFARTMKESRMNEVILFPQAGPVTLATWIEAIHARKLKVIVGGIMTHSGFTASEGGFIRDDAVNEIYRIAFEKGVRDFVVPLTKPAETHKIYNDEGLDDSCTFYSPGYGKQGGEVEQFGFLKNHYIIIGRSLLNADDPMKYLDTVENELKHI